MPADIYFFDAPVYRLKEKKYYSDREKHIDAVRFPAGAPYSLALRELESKNPRQGIAMIDDLQRAYGGCWRFNEIIGYIRLHFLGSQIRGEYFAVTKKRIVRTRTKTLEFQTWKLAPEIDVPADAKSSDIFRLVMDYLADCSRELKGRHIDTESLQTIGAYVDWRKFYLDHLGQIANRAAAYRASHSRSGTRSILPS